MADWPAYANPQVTPHQVDVDPGLARTPYDDGYTRQKRIYSAARHTLTVVVPLTQDDKTLFAAWVRDDLNTGANQFSFPLYGSSENVQAQIVAGRVRYVLGDPQAERPWQAYLTLEFFA